MHPVKLLAAVLFKLEGPDALVEITDEDVRAASVADKDNLFVFQKGNTLTISLIGRDEAERHVSEHKTDQPRIRRVANFG